MASLPSLGGLAGIVADPNDTSDVYDEGVLEARGGPVASGHSEYGSQANGYSGTVPAESPFSGMDVYDGWDPATGYAARGYAVGGEAIDTTPTSHTAPYPRGIIQQSWDHPDALAAVGEQNQQLHAPDFGAQKFYNGNSPAGHEEPAHYTTDMYVAPNDNVLTEVPGQIKGTGYGHGGGGYGGGNADTTQGYGSLSEYEQFSHGRSIRRVQHDTVHFDYTNTHGEQNDPFYGRHPVYQNQLDGPDSPYFEQGSIDGGLVVWEGRIGDPSPYVQPVEPVTVPASYSDDVWAWS